MHYMQMLCYRTNQNSNGQAQQTNDHISWIIISYKNTPRNKKSATGTQHPFEPFHKAFMSSFSRFSEYNSCCSYLRNSYQIRSHYSTCPKSWTVMMCKFVTWIDKLKSWFKQRDYYQDFNYELINPQPNSALNISITAPFISYGILDVL